VNVKSEFWAMKKKKQVTLREERKFKQKDLIS
jgi:hypothetical protein